MITAHPPHRDAHEAFMVSTGDIIAVNSAPYTPDLREQQAQDLARAIASFTQALCAEEVL